MRILFLENESGAESPSSSRKENEAPSPQLDNLSASKVSEGMTCRVNIAHSSEAENEALEYQKKCQSEFADSAYRAIMSTNTQQLDLKPEDVKAALEGPYADEFKSMIGDAAGRRALRDILSTKEGTGDADHAPVKSDENTEASVGEGHQFVQSTDQGTQVKEVASDISPETEKKLKEQLVALENADFDAEDARINREIASEEYSIWQDRNFQAEYYIRQNEYSASWQKEYERKMIEREEDDGGDNVHNRSNESDTDVSQSAYEPTYQEQARMIRINNFLAKESGGDMIVTLDYIPSGQDNKPGHYVLKDEYGYIVDDPGWTKFPTRKQAIKAQIRYELFSEPPLDRIRDMGPDKIEKLINDPAIRKVGMQLNPDEPFRAKGLRRLLFVSMLKEMNPTVYEKQSYDAILNNQGQTLVTQFRNNYRAHGDLLGFRSIATFDELKAKLINLIESKNKKNGSGAESMNWPV